MINNQLPQNAHLTTPIDSYSTSDSPTIPLNIFDEVGVNQLPTLKRPNWFGIASLSISLIVGYIVFLTIIAATLIAMSPGQSTQTGFMITGLLIIGSVFADLVAIALGIVGLVQRGRKRVTALLGVIISAITVFGIVMLMLIGSLA